MFPANLRYATEPTLIALKTFVFLCLILICTVAGAQSWLPLPDFPGTERDDGTAFVIGNKAYCGSGLAPWWAPFGDFYSFDFISHEWTPIASLPEGNERQYAAGFSDGNSGYLFGGVTGQGYENDLWMYDPNSDEWTELTALPGAGRSGAAHFVIDNTAYIVGGKNDDNDAMVEVWSYDLDSEIWTQKNDLPFGGRWRASATALNGLGYLVFGLDENNTYRNEFYVYDPETDNWLPMPGFPLAGRTHAALAAWGDGLYLFAGMDSSTTAHHDFWTFQPVELNWTEMTSLPAAGRRGGMGFVHNNAFYYTTGIDSEGNRLTETWKYDLNTGIKTKDMENEVRIFPNPAKDYFTLLLGAQQLTSSVHCRVYNANGRLVWQQSLTGMNTKVNTAEWATGMYNVVLFNDDSRGVVQWVKE